MDFVSLKLFTLLLFIFSLRVDGRENFSKFTHVVNTQINEKMNNNNNVNETAVPNKVDPLEKQNQDDQDPTFVPETQNAYGLYGRDNSPKEKTTPYYSENNNDNSGSYYYNNHNNNYDDDQYENGVPEDMITDTSLLGSEKQGNQRQYNNGESLYNSDEELDNSNAYSKYNSNNRGNRYNSNQYNTENKYGYNNEQQYHNNEQPQNYNNANRYNNQQQQNYNGANKYINYDEANTYNTGKQGMSDTRFLENGRYYYDVNNEHNYRRDYNTQRYVSNNQNAYEFDKSGDEYKYQQNP